jgi:NAD(P)H-flavin reductase/hemoglobin-like flavoprotein
MRSWSRDLDTLSRLHKGLRALDADAESGPLSTPVLTDSPPGRPAPIRDGEEQQDGPGSALPPGQDTDQATEDPRAAAPAPEAAPARPAAEQPEAPEAVPAAADEATRASDAAPQPDDDGARPWGEAAQSDDQPPSAAADEQEEPEAAPPPDTAPGRVPPEPGPAAGPDPAIAAIRETFRYIADAGDKAVGYFYGQLFLRQPHLRQLFPPAMDEQRDRLFCALGRIVESLSTPDEMAAYLSQLGRDHRKYQVQPEMYEAVGAALLATLRAFARDAFTSPAEEAWTQIYLAGSSLMIKAAEEDAAAGPASWTAEVVSVDHRADDIAVLTIAPDQPLPFTAGQHVTVQTPRWPRVWRSYSIACMPRDDGLLALHVKAVPGGWVSTALVRYTSPGSQLVLGPPLGTMTLKHAAGRDLLCVAGGTGLSPVKAIAEQAVRESSVTPRRIHLFYGARRRHELYDLPDLWRLQDAYSGFELIPVTSDDPAFEGMQGNVGRVAARYMPHVGCEAYVAGPPEMVRETVRVLTRAGVERERIHFDDALLAGRARTGS